jgi:exodeoxyribonuclease VII small subunit
MAKHNFEESLARLEQINRDLEEGDFSLEESLKIFDEGVKLAEYCNRKLDEAQKKVDLLLKKGGSLTAVPFEEAEQPETEDTRAEK